MSKAYSRKERKLFGLIRTVVIIIIVILLLIISGTIFSNNYSNNSVTYTPEQLEHDHDGDGIPDH